MMEVADSEQCEWVKLFPDSKAMEHLYLQPLYFLPVMYRTDALAKAMTKSASSLRSMD